MINLKKITKEILIVTISLFALYLLMSVESNFSSTIQKKANDIITMCTNEGGDHSVCYEREVPKLYPKLSVSEIFDVIRFIRSKDSSYQFCHVLSHLIGEKVVAEDPNKWVDAVSLNPKDGYCSNGFIHGVIGGRFRAEVLDNTQLEALIPDFKRACEPHAGWEPSTLDKAICYHGMGHLYDFITDANLNKALDLCERTTTESYRRVCREGVFMQIYQPLEPDDYLMISRMKVKPATTTVRSFCSIFSSSPEYEGACLRESWPFFRTSIIDGTGAKSFCSGQPNSTEKENCYQSISSIVGRMSLNNPTKVALACGNFPDEGKDICYGTSAQAVLEENRSDSEKAISLCNLAPEKNKTTCLITLIDHASFIFGGDVMRYNKFCSLLPMELGQRCKQGQGIKPQH